MFNSITSIIKAHSSFYQPSISLLSAFYQPSISLLIAMVSFGSPAASSHILEAGLDPAGAGIDCYVSSHSLSSSSYIAFQSRINRASQSKGNFLAAGIGRRQQIASRWAIGGYCFYDHSLQNDHRTSHFSKLNPGIEIISPLLRLGINAHVPIKTNLSEVDQAKSTYFSEHSQFKHHYLDENLGFDVKVALELFPGLSPFSGAYYFHSKNKESVLGGVGGLNYSLNETIHLSAQATYDPIYQTRFMFGIKFRLASSRSKEATALHSLWVHDINRHLIPIMHTQSDRSIHNPIFRFKGNSLDLSTEEVTPERPSTNLDQLVIDRLPKNAKILVASDECYGMPVDGTLKLQPGQSLWGCNSQWEVLHDSPKLTIEQLILTGSNQVGNFTLSSLHKTPILIENASQVLIQNVSAKRIAIINSQGIAIKDSKIEDFRMGRRDVKTGLNMLNSSRITLNNIKISNTKHAINAINCSNISINGSQLSSQKAPVVFSRSNDSTISNSHLERKNYERQKKDPPISLVEVDHSSVNLTGNSLCITAHKEAIESPLYTVWKSDNSSTALMEGNEITLNRVDLFPSQRVPVTAIQLPSGFVLQVDEMINDSSKESLPPMSQVSTSESAKSGITLSSDHQEGQSSNSGWEEELADLNRQHQQKMEAIERNRAEKKRQQEELAKGEEPAEKSIIEDTATENLKFDNLLKASSHLIAEAEAAAEETTKITSKSLKLITLDEEIVTTQSGFTGSLNFSDSNIKNAYENLKSLYNKYKTDIYNPLDLFPNLTQSENLKNIINELDCLLLIKTQQGEQVLDDYDKLQDIWGALV